ncbi:hypothetical protein [Chitinophaga sp.]|uniref:hypothetical protein n=1 Tax=Chitinophaga sp. TaxID=1869181 RepID=UPI0031DB7A79
MKHLNSIRIFAPVLLLLCFSRCTPRNPDNFQIPLNKARASRHVISQREADNLINGFLQGKKELQARLPGNYLDSAFNLPNAEMFNRDAIAALLNARGADGIRIYLGRDEKGQVRLVLLPVDRKGNDIHTTLVSRETALSIPGIESATARDDLQAMESGQRCPPLCKDVQPQ